MEMTDAEIEATRFHLGFGNLDFGAYPYTADDFKQIFADVVAPNLTVGAETTATTSVPGGGAVTTVTPVSMTGIVAQARLVVDVGDGQETIVVMAMSGSTFSARFLLAHPASGYPVCVESGQTRLRLLLQRAHQAWLAVMSPAAGATAGIKQVDEIQFFQAQSGASGNAVLNDLRAQYKAIVMQIASLTRVPPQWLDQQCGRSQLEAY